MPSPSRRRIRKRICPPPPQWSERTYVRIGPSDIALFRFLLEGHDNLGLFTVVDKYKGILLLRYSPHLHREMHRFLKDAGTEMELTILPSPLQLI